MLRFRRSRARAEVTTIGDRRPAPSVAAIAVLVASALALIATTPPPPTLEGYVIGQVVLGGGETLQRELRIHLDPAGGGAERGKIWLSLQASNGLQHGSPQDVALGFASGPGTSRSSPLVADFPLARCRAGCDLSYPITIWAKPTVLPASVVRYDVSVELHYGYQFRELDESWLRLDLDGRATGPVAPLWSILAGVVALVLGIVAGPRIRAATRLYRRDWPALALVAVPVGLIAWLAVQGGTRLVEFGAARPIPLWPLYLVAFVDPWSTILLGTLAWGVWRGLRRRSTDGGWLLGLAAVATVGLGGLWLAMWLTLDTVVQPLVLAIPFVVLGAVGGIVIGQAWRTDERATKDRWWGALAVLSHGIVIAGFGFVGQQALFDPFPPPPTTPLAVIPAALVALAFRRWLRGRGGLLILLDLLIAAVGILGVWWWFWGFSGYSTGPRRFEIDDVAVVLALAAALVALVTSFHRTPEAPGADADGTMPASAVSTIATGRRARTADDPTRT